MFLRGPLAIQFLRVSGPLDNRRIDSDACGFRARPIHFHLLRHRPTMENSISYKPEVETVSKTGSTNNLATETDIDAISMAIAYLCFFGESFHVDNKLPFY